MTAPPEYDPSAYPPFAVTVDIAVFTFEDSRLLVALIQRGSEPFKGAWALPGGFVEPDEDLVTAAVRELAEETGLRLPPQRLSQVGAYGDPERDPRMRVVSVAYWTLVPELSGLREGSDAAAVELVPVDDALADPESLAFDHQQILSDAVREVRRELEPNQRTHHSTAPETTEKAR